MSRRHDDLTVKRCGCIEYLWGPPFVCDRHASETKKGLRALISDDAHDRLGHRLTRWREYESLRGKWTAFCVRCHLIAIVYDTPPRGGGDQMLGAALKTACTGEHDGEEVEDVVELEDRTAGVSA